MTNNQVNSDDIKNKLGLENTETHRKKWVLYVIIILLLTAATAYVIVTNKKSEKVKYVTHKLQMRDLVVTVSATGNIEPTNTVDVGIEVSGTIIKLYADFNQHVKKGDILARLDTTKLESRVKNSEASLLVAKANLSERKISVKDTKNELQRGRTTYKSTHGKYPSDKDLDALQNNYDRAIANYNASEAGVTQAYAQLKSDEDDLKKAVVRSPINGVVLDRKVEVGQSVVSSMQIPVLFTLAEDLSKMQVILSVDEADIGQVHEGQNVEFLVDAYPEQTFKGIITQVRFNSVIVGGVVTYSTVVEVDNSLLLLRPGMTASAEIITKVIENTFVVSNAVLRFSLKGQADDKLKGKQIWILQNNLPQNISVTSAQSDGIFTAVSGDNLKEGMQVIVNTQKEK
ncbi:HlyD family secretion protein [Epsilonproteobacteria bacterium SCGC AD-308-P11]|nr:HlyD family secretion protein [Epsilonproteobacteria bacterium SCGC AD-308-P11]